jgi:prepilin-type N-terminal cleavage/methylation domain-containing protein
MRSVRHNLGVSLIEMLISMAIFSVIAFLTFMLVSGALTYNARQQATVAAQGKLRRVVEVVSQELRGSVFGGVSNTPYVSGANQVSLYLLEQGAGYPILNGTGNTFQVLADTAPALKQLLLIDTLGKAVAYNVDTVTGSGNTWTIKHECTTTLPGATLAFGVKSLGFKLDNGTLLLNENNQTYPMAFDITEFSLKYVYSSSGSLTSPINVAGVPVKFQKVGGVDNILTELQFTLATKEFGRGEVQRMYTGQVPLLVTSNNSSGANQFNFSGVEPCI